MLRINLVSSKMCWSVASLERRKTISPGASNQLFDRIVLGEKSLALHPVE
jgi:hypothetical protein